MPYDEGLAERLNEYFHDRLDVEVKRMFGGLCFMVSNHMCCGIVGDMLMLRVGPENYEPCLQKRYVKKMDFTGKEMKGMVYVTSEGFESDTELARWVELGESFTRTLPPKKSKSAKN